jgi:hypothetical protein
MIISLIISFVTFFVCVGMIGLMVQQWLKSKNLDTYKTQKYFIEIFSSLREDWMSRSYNILNYGRRSLLVALVIFLKNINVYAMTSIFTVIQLFYLSIIICLRPFDSKNNIIEIINEVVFTIVSASLICLNKETNWNTTLSKVFMFSILGNTLIVSLILIVALIIQVKKNGLKCKSKSENKVQDEPKTMVIINPIQMLKQREANRIRNLANNGVSMVSDNSRLKMYNERSVNTNNVKVDDGVCIRRLPPKNTQSTHPISTSPSPINYLNANMKAQPKKIEIFKFSKN